MSKKKKKKCKTSKNEKCHNKKSCSLYEVALQEFQEEFCSTEDEEVICGVQFETDVVLTKDHFCSDIDGGIIMGEGTTLDCNGHAISCDDSDGCFGGVGIDARAGVTIKNCIVTGPFSNGILVISTGDGAVTSIENVHVNGASITGIFIEGGAMLRDIASVNNGGPGITIQAEVDVEAVTLQNIFSCGNSETLSGISLVGSSVLNKVSFDGEIVSNAPGVRTCTGVISGCTFDETIAKDCVSTCADNYNIMD